MTTMFNAHPTGPGTDTHTSCCAPARRNSRVGTVGAPITVPVLVAAVIVLGLLRTPAAGLVDNRIVALHCHRHVTGPSADPVGVRPAALFDADSLAGASTCAGASYKDRQVVLGRAMHRREGDRAVEGDEPPLMRDRQREQVSVTHLARTVQSGTVHDLWI